jgi:hypothetical protein
MGLHSDLQVIPPRALFGPLATGHRVAALTLKSSNRKTGPIPVSTSTAAFCPVACPLRSDRQTGCYATGGPQGIHWRAVTAGARGQTWPEFCRAVADLPPGQLWRHNVAGDLPGNGRILYGGRCDQLVRANSGRRGFTYTHYPVTGGTRASVENRETVALMNTGGFTVNLSANDLAHADLLADTGAGPVCTLLVNGDRGQLTPAGRPVAVCPAVLSDSVTCHSCGLCQKPGHPIIGFPVHGAGARSASGVATGAGPGQSGFLHFAIVALLAIIGSAVAGAFERK